MLTMPWYSAHIIIAMKKVAEDDEYLVHENVVLIQASSFELALISASAIGRREVELEPNLLIDGVPAVKRFAGIRKVISVQNPDPLNSEMDQPVSGAELSYSVLLVKGSDQLDRLVGGHDVAVEYLE